MAKKKYPRDAYVVQYDRRPVKVRILKKFEASYCDEDVDSRGRRWAPRELDATAKAAAKKARKRLQRDVETFDKALVRKRAYFAQREAKIAEFEAKHG